jgi:hypothetical protein
MQCDPTTAAYDLIAFIKAEADTALSTLKQPR